jgi:hypothetical protein
LFFLNIEFDTSHSLAASERLDCVESRAQMSVVEMATISYCPPNLPEEAGYISSHFLRGYRKLQKVGKVYL